jgi:hypothetical protein
MRPLHSCTLPLLYTYMDYAYILTYVCPILPSLNASFNTKSSTMSPPQNAPRRVERCRRCREAALLQLMAPEAEQEQEQEQEQEKEQEKERELEAEAEEAEEDQDKKNSLLSLRIFRTTGGPRLRLGCRAASNGRWCA